MPDRRLRSRATRALTVSALALTGCRVCVHGPNWPFKTGTDPDTPRVDMTPVLTTIAELGAIPHVEHPPGLHRIPAELRTYTLRDVTLRSFERSPDGDVHLVLTDEQGQTMIAEAPTPRCTAESSPWRAQIAAVREIVDDRVGWSLVGRRHWTVSMTGVGYMDYLHGQPGAAPNGIEIHPILSICFGEGCALPEITRADPPSSAPGPVLSTWASASASPCSRSDR